MEEQILHLSYWKDNSVCLTFLVSLEICGHKDFHAVLPTISKNLKNLQGRAHQLVCQCQTVSPENIHTGSIIQTGQVIFRNIYVYTYVHANNLFNHEFEGEWEEDIYEGLEGGTGTEKCN